VIAGNFQTKVLFETAGSQVKGETTAIQNRMHPSQQKFFDLLGTQTLHATRERIFSHINSLIQLRLRIGWLEVRPIQVTRLEDLPWKTILLLS
jgi:hypothetical protein